MSESAAPTPSTPHGLRPCSAQGERAGHAPAGPPPEPGGGRLPRLLLFLAVLVASGISTVWEHVRAVRAGYRLHALEMQRERLHEERRRLEIRKAREERIDVLEERARALGIPNPLEAPSIEGVGG